MGFTGPQWVRHIAKFDATPDGMLVVCVRCGITLPVSLMPGQIVLSREDRLFIGDDPRAQDCR